MDACKKLQEYGKYWAAKSYLFNSKKQKKDSAYNSGLYLKSQFVMNLCLFDCRCWNCSLSESEALSTIKDVTSTFEYPVVARLNLLPGKHINHVPLAYND